MDRERARGEGEKNCRPSDEDELLAKPTGGKGSSEASASCLTGCAGLSECASVAQPIRKANVLTSVIKKCKKPLYNFIRLPPKLIIASATAGVDQDGPIATNLYQSSLLHGKQELLELLNLLLVLLQHLLILNFALLVFVDACL